MDAKQLFEILMRENADMLIAYIRSGVRDGAVADDVFQETMLAAWRRLDDDDRDRPAVRALAAGDCVPRPAFSVRHVASGT